MFHTGLAPSPIEQLYLYQFSTEVVNYVAAWQVTLPTSIEFRPLVQGLLNANDPPLISITNGLGKGHAMVVVHWPARSG